MAQLWIPDYVSFEFDARYIKEDTDIVVFESLYSEDKELAVHADLEDASWHRRMNLSRPSLTVMIHISNRAVLTFPVFRNSVCVLPERC